MMAGMLTLILIDLLRGVRTQRSLVFEISRYGTNWPSSSAPRRAHACGRPTGCCGS
jgi:hypothetical protein